jgi:hypothetical protein
MPAAGFQPALPASEGVARLSGARGQLRVETVPPRVPHPLPRDGTRSLGGNVPTGETAVSHSPEGAQWAWQAAALLASAEVRNLLS